MVATQSDWRKFLLMSLEPDKAAEKLRLDAVKAAEKLRKAEVRMAEKLAAAEAKAAKKLAKAEARTAGRLARAQARAAKKFWRTHVARRGIKIDLLSEARDKEERRRNHPIKRAAWVAGFFVSVMLLWLLDLQLAINLSQMKSRGLEKRFAAVKAKDASAKTDLRASAEMVQKLAALDKLAANRFLWAPLLNALQKIMIDDIQVTRLTGEQKFTREASRTFGAGARKVVVPACVEERDSVAIEARDKSSDEQSYLKFKESLSRADYFVRNLRSRDGFILEGVLKIPSSNRPGASNQFTTFVLRSHFPAVRREE
jgi:hypothetical protein